MRGICKQCYSRPRRCCAHWRRTVDCLQRTLSAGKEMCPRLQGHRWDTFKIDSREVTMMPSVEESGGSYSLPFHGTKERLQDTVKCTWKSTGAPPSPNLRNWHQSAMVWRCSIVGKGPELKMPDHEEPGRHANDLELQPESFGNPVEGFKQENDASALTLSKT